MRFNNLRIENLRAIRRFEISDLTDFVVVAGQNGSGKSCVFDAIRLLKSLYGGYQANEYHQWFGEFAVSFGDASSMRKLFRSPDIPIAIEADVSLAISEREFIKANLDSLVQPLAWQAVTGQPIDPWSFSRVSQVVQLRSRGPEIAAKTAEIAERILGEVDNDSHHLQVLVLPSGDVKAVDALTVEASFQAFAPRHLGLIEYHSASRNFSRQQLGGITLDVRTFEEQRRQHLLYNSQAKYQNIKTELASGYVRSIIARQTDGEVAQTFPDLARILHSES